MTQMTHKPEIVRRYKASAMGHLAKNHDLNPDPTDPNFLGFVLSK